jgi:hypothetical protein
MISSRIGLTKMKTGIIALFAGMLVLSACASSSNMAKSENKAADFERTATLIEGGNYKFTVRSASPAGARTIQITSIYAMKASDGSYEARLPYFGEVYSAAYGQGGSVEFKGEPEGLQINRNEKKHKISLSFSITSNSEKYDVKLTVGASGYGNLVISSSKRKTISYYGQAGGLEN